MLVAFDADVLSLLLDPNSDAPSDPETGQPVSRAADRLEYLIATLQQDKARIILPAPALAEFLVIVDESGPDYLSAIDQRYIFSIEPFDARAAVEAAAMTRRAIAKGDKKSGALGAWQAVKADRQIVAIAKTRGVSRIYSNDGDMMNIAAGDSEIEVIPVWQLPMPPAEQQHLFQAGQPDESDPADTD